MFIQGELIYQCEKFLCYYLMFIKHSGSCEYSSLWAQIISVDNISYPKYHNYCKLRSQLK